MLAQAIEAQVTAAQLALQVALHPGQIVGSGADMQGIHHQLGGLIRRQGHQQLPPEFLPCLARQDLGLQLGAQQRPGFAPEALDHMAEIDAPQRTLLALALMQARDRLDELAAEEQVQPVMAQVHRELMTDQP